MHIPKHRDPKLRAKVDRLRQRGLFFSEIGKRLGIGYATAWRIWHRVGTLDKSGHGPSRRFDEVAA